MSPVTRCITLLAFALLATGSLPAAAPAAKPNLLWLVAEDINAHLGCYGDTYATTPNLDKLAARGMIYLNAWSTAPVCAPARTALISGMYPPSLGAEHMRSMVTLAPAIKMYPNYLREAGYFCSNNAKTDYNLQETGKTWDISSAKAHYQNRAAGQPFFAVFNHEITHESKLRTRPHQWIHDPAKVRLPAYHPDTLEARQDWAQYHDNITAMDAQVGKKLADLERAGLAEDTIVFFYGDNGSGMPRSKRWPYNSGLRVPLIIHFPDKFKSLAPAEYRPGGKTDRLVNFVDFAPTVLSLAGVKPPDHMQGRAFAGPFATPALEYIFGLRGRMDERLDLVRSVRDQRYIYIRNFMPHKIYGQFLAYMFETPTTRVWKRLYDEGKLNTAQSRFWQTKPPEELYDLQADPDEVNNLAESPQHQATLQRLRQTLHNHLVATRDLGLLPEDEIHRRAQGSSTYEMGQDEAKYPLPKILAAAELASGLKPEALPQLRQAMQDTDSAVRYWGTLGILMRGRETVLANKADLTKALQDAAPSVRIAAAEALGRFGNESEVKSALAVLLELAPQQSNGPFVSIQALNALVELGDKAKPGLEVIRKSGGANPNYETRPNGYAPRLVQQLVKDLEK